MSFLAIVQYRMIRTTRGSQKKRLISIVVVGLDKGTAGDYKEMSIFADQLRSRIPAPMRGDRGGCGVSASEY